MAEETFEIKGNAETINQYTKVHKLAPGSDIKLRLTKTKDDAIIKFNLFIDGHEVFLNYAHASLFIAQHLEPDIFAASNSYNLKPVHKKRTVKPTLQTPGNPPAKI